MIRKLPEIQDFVRVNGKVIIVLLVSITCVFLIVKRFEIDAQNIVQVALTVGFFHQASLYIIAYFLRKNTDLRKWHTYFRPNRRYSAGKLVLHLIQFFILIFILPLSSWNVATTTLLLSTFLAGMALGHLLTSFLLPETDEELQPIEKRTQLDSERYEAFIATIITSVVLGSSFLQMEEHGSDIKENGFLLLPISYAIINTFFTYFFLCINQNHFKVANRFKLLFSVLSLMVHYFIIEYLVAFTIPEVFLLKGVEYKQQQIKLVMEIGLIAGFVAGLLVLAYHHLADLHIKHMLKKEAIAGRKNFIIRIFLNVILYLSPIFCVIFTFYFSNEILGLYGLTLTFLCMLSNIGLKLFIQYDRLDFSLEHNQLNPDRAAKLKVQSPSIGAKLMQIVENFYTRSNKTSKE